MTPSSFHGVMELGGASFQITFLPTVHDRTGQGLQQGGDDAPVRLPGGLISLPSLSADRIILLRLYTISSYQL